jgi:hypothetical protein
MLGLVMTLSPNRVPRLEVITGVQRRQSWPDAVKSGSWRKAWQQAMSSPMPPGITEIVFEAVVVRLNGRIGARTLATVLKALGVRR